MAAPEIPFVKLPELPLTFLARMSDAAVGALLGAILGALAGSSFGPKMAKTERGRLATTALVALLGALVGYARAPHLFDPEHPPTIKPFGTLVAIGVYIGSIVAMRHARERGINVKRMSDFIFWVVAAGFIGGHVLDAIFYHPSRVVKDPLYVFMLWDGLSSYGGFTGALVGAFAWKIVRQRKILGMCEVINSAFPLAWCFGRAGCASVHDHPGKLSDAWYAVKWETNGIVTGRLDLGFLELVASIPLAVAFLVLWRRSPRRPLGFYTGIMCTYYAPIRFGLDFLREQENAGVNGGDPRYGGLTPAQWACFGLLGVGIYFLRMAIRRSGKGSTKAPDQAGKPRVPGEPEPAPAGARDA